MTITVLMRCIKPFIKIFFFLILQAQITAIRHGREINKNSTCGSQSERGEHGLRACRFVHQTTQRCYRVRTFSATIRPDRSILLMHQLWIRYTKLIETIYSWCFFFLVGCNMLIISVVGLQVKFFVINNLLYWQRKNCNDLQILKRANKPGENARFIVFLVANMMHLYMENYMSQILMDSSFGIRYSV